MIKGLAHFSFTVGDMEKSLTFYHDLLGFQVDFVVERSGPVTEAIVGIPAARLKIAMLVLDNFNLELIQYLFPSAEKLQLKPNMIGCAHLALYVNDLDETYGFLSAKGVQFRSRPNYIKDGPNAGWKAVYLYDPDGNILELMQKANKNVS